MTLLSPHRDPGPTGGAAPRRARRRAGLASLLAGAAFTALTALPASAFGPLDDVHLAGASSTSGSQLDGIDTATNFPTWFQDRNGVTLKLCTANDDPLHMCLGAPVDPTAPNAAYQRQIGFGDEAFWWLGQADFDIVSPDCPDCRRGLVLFSIEAAYNGGDALRNDEFTFGRMRMWIDTPYKGHYKVTHPFGVEAFDAEAGIKGIRTTIDVGTSYPDYSGPLHADSKVRNFLVWDGAVQPPAPPGYIGDSTVTHAVTGATHYEQDATGEWKPYNKVRIELTACAADAPVCPTADATGTLWAIETDQFTVQGRVFDGKVPTPLSVQRATITAGNGSPVISVFAQALVGANVQVSIDGGSAVTMNQVSATSSGAADFQVDIPWNNAALPQTATVTAVLQGDVASTLSVPVTDVVAVVGSPQYDVANRTLTVTATSSAQGLAPAPQLSLFGINFPLQPPPQPGVAGAVYSATVTKIPPSSSLQVLSSMGGKATGTPQPINTPNPDPPPPPVVGPAPVAVADSASTSILTPIVVPVATNDTGSLDLNSIQLVANSGPTKGTIGPIGPSGITYIPGAQFGTGTDQFQYTIANSDGVRSNAATVTITMQPEQIIPSVTQWTRNKGAWRVRGTTNATTNNTISAYLVHNGVEKFIGSFVADPVGAYDICTACNKGGTAVPAGTATPVAGDTVTVKSSYGTVVSGNAITIK